MELLTLLRHNKLDYKSHGHHHGLQISQIQIQNVPFHGFQGSDPGKIGIETTV